ncbi:MAG: sugar phosphate nucleotidyltransferase, partial [Eubacterium sp.]
FDFAHDNAVTIHNNVAEPWKVTLVDTGLNTMTGGRVKRVQKYIGNESFMLTYGDGVCDVNINALVAFHQQHKKMATITAVEPGGRFGILDIEGDGRISNFAEKKKEDGGWINGGFMVLEPEIFNFIDGDSTVFEQYPLEECARRNELVAYKHNGFWQCMDTLREKNMLEALVEKGEAPWVKW